jgi:hypothetical protein
VLGSLVVNERPRVRRSEVDTLRAVLHNCVRHGPSTQDREERPTSAATSPVGSAGWPSTTRRGARGCGPSLERIDWTR